MCAHRTYIFALWQLYSKLCVTVTHGKNFAIRYLEFFLKADKDDISGCLKMPPIYESVAEFQYYLEYICSQSHACNLLCIMPLLVQIIEVAAPVVVGAAVLAKCEILNCCNSLNSSWVSNLYNCNFF